MVWDSTIGTSDQSVLEPLPIADWRAVYDLGDHDASRPIRVAIEENGDLVVGPKPDKAYSLRLRYYTQSTDFALTTDVPGIPAEYHDIIVYRALMLWAAREEMGNKYQYFELEMKRWQHRMENDPRIGPAFGVGPGPLT